MIEDMIRGCHNHMIDDIGRQGVDINELYERIDDYHDRVIAAMNDI